MNAVYGNAGVFNCGREMLRSGAGFRAVAGKRCLKTNSCRRGRISARWPMANLSAGGTRRRDRVRFAGNGVHFLTLQVFIHALRQNTQWRNARRVCFSDRQTESWLFPAILDRRCHQFGAAVWARALLKHLRRITFQHRRPMYDEAPCRNRWSGQPIWRGRPQPNAEVENEARTLTR